MKDEIDDVFGNEAFDETDVAETEIETEAEEVAVEETVEEHDESQTEEVETTAETEVETETVQEAPEEPTTVPLAALQSVREMAQARQAEIQRLQKQLAEFESAKAQSNKPDMYEDPDGYTTYIEGQIEARVAAALQQREQAATEQKFLAAREKALATHGEQFVTELAEWMTHYTETVDPNVGDKALLADDPVQFCIDLRTNREFFAAYEANPEEAIRQQALARGIVPSAANAVPVTQTTSAPKKSVGPKSAVGMTSQGSQSSSGSSDIVGDIFR